MVILSVYTIKKSYTPLVAYLVCDPYTVKFLAEIHSAIIFSSESCVSTLQY